METEKSTTVTNQGHNVNSSVAGGATVVTENARLILQQAVINALPEIPKLLGHQKSAQNQSQEWVDKIWPLIINTTAEIIDYANTFQATYNALLELIPRLQAGDMDARDEFVQALKGALIPELQSKLSRANEIATSIKQFHNDFEPLYSEFQKDFTEANKVITKDKMKIQDDQASRVKWDTISSLEVVAILVCGATLPVTAVAMAMFPEIGIGVLIGGGIFMAGEVTAMGVLLHEYAEAVQKVKDLTIAIKKIKSRVTQLDLIEDQISDLQKNTENVVTFSANVVDGWVALCDNMHEAIAHLQKISLQQDAAVLINLKAANNDWGVVLQQAKNLQSNCGRLEQKMPATSNEPVKAIQAQAKDG